MFIPDRSISREDIKAHLRISGINPLPEVITEESVAQCIHSQAARAFIGNLVLSQDGVFSEDDLPEDQELESFTEYMVNWLDEDLVGQATDMLKRWDDSYFDLVDSGGIAINGMDEFLKKATAYTGNQGVELELHKERLTKGHYTARQIGSLSLFESNLRLILCQPFYLNRKNFSEFKDIFDNQKQRYPNLAVPTLLDQLVHAATLKTPGSRLPRQILYSTSFDMIHFDLAPIESDRGPVWPYSELHHRSRLSFKTAPPSFYSNRTHFALT